MMVWRVNRSSPGLQAGQARSNPGRVAPKDEPSASAQLDIEVETGNRRPLILAGAGVLACVLGAGGMVAVSHMGKKPDPGIDHPVVGEPKVDPKVEPKVEPGLQVQPAAAKALHVESEPAGAQVKLGDKVLGKTPLDVNLPAGTELPARLVLSLQGYTDLSIESQPGPQGEGLLAKGTLQKATDKKPPVSAGTRLSSTVGSVAGSTGTMDAEIGRASCRERV